MLQITADLREAYRAGRREEAAERVRRLLDEHIASARRPWSPFQQVLAVAFEQYDDSTFADGLRLASGSAHPVKVADHARDEVWIVFFERASSEGFTLTFSPKLRTSLGYGHLMANVIKMLPLFCKVCDETTTFGRALLNNWDASPLVGLSYCSNDPTHFLIPDPEFISSHGYREFRDSIASGAPAWSGRRDLAGWRGTATGQRVTADWQELGRIRLARVSALWPDLVDAKITGAPHDMPAATYNGLADDGLTGSYIPISSFLSYRYVVDIDGYTNAWGSYFTKLLSGSTVIKVASERGYRQWYYSRLRPWLHYVPVRSDLADLTAQVLWLRQHPSEGQAMAEAASAAAQSMTYEIEMSLAVETVVDAMKKMTW